MPFEQMDMQQVASYLHLDAREVRKLASRGRMPCRKRKDGFVFRKIEIDHWIETQLHELPSRRLAQIEVGVRRHHGMDEDDLLVHQMIPEGGIAVPLRSRTRASVLRDLVAMADACGVVYAADELHRAIVDREQVHSTALTRDVALPHPREHTPYDIAASFIVAGRSPCGLPFGAPDGSLTRLFFLICCKDDRTHLHVLTRLSRMLRRQDTITALLEAADDQEFRDELKASEWLALSVPIA
ncbi:MAG: PTS sugar transporter subunit IIA [Planctomycetota bacterium]